MTIHDMLNQLYEMRVARNDIEDAKQAELNKVITPEIKTQMMNIEAEFSDKLGAADAAIAQLELEIKVGVITNGATVKGKKLMAVYNKGREGGWDSAKLKGFAMAHPEILAAKKPDGEPTVTIRGA